MPLLSTIMISFTFFIGRPTCLVFAVAIALPSVGLFSCDPFGRLQETVYCSFDA